MAGTTVTLTPCVERGIGLSGQAGTVLGMGAWFRNTLCIASGNEAFVSRSVGDLGDPEACRQHEQTARELLAWLDRQPAAIAHDLHPDFHSSRFALRLADEFGIPAIGVQHHHAHIAAVCAEHGVDEPVLGLALDGVGLGTDGTAWGGELLRVDGAAFERLGYLSPLPLPGGDRAALEPWRMAVAVLHKLGRSDEISKRYAGEPAASTIAAMLQRGLNCPLTSSMGRVFDSAAGLLGLSPRIESDAQAAIALEQAATRGIERNGVPPPLEDGWKIDDEGRLDLLPLLGNLAEYRAAEEGAALFHATLAAALADWVLQSVRQTGIRTVACGGGCFFNKLLSEYLRQHLEVAGIRVLYALAIQPGDTAISLGQVWVARKILEREN